MYRSHDRPELRQLYLADAAQLVVDLLLLRLQLFGVRQVLPFASAADAEMRTHRFFAYRAPADETDDRSFTVSAFLPAHLQVYNIPWDDKGNEDDLVINMGNALPFGCHSFYRDVFKNG